MSYQLFDCNFTRLKNIKTNKKMKFVSDLGQYFTWYSKFYVMQCSQR